MARIEFKISSLSPLVFSEGGSLNTISTKSYIPGNIIRGMFASAYIQKKNLGKNAHMDNPFFQWFLKGSLCFENAYIGSTSNKNFPVPFSMQREKENKGEIRDKLIDEDEINVPLQPIRGFGRFDSNGKGLNIREVRKTLNFHHQRDAKKGIAQKGKFFVYESIAPDQIFWGGINGDKNSLVSFREEFDTGNSYRIGRSRGNQYGKITLEFLDSLEKENKITIRNGCLSLTFFSDVIIYDANGWATTDNLVLEQKLRERVGQSLAINKAFVRTGEVENFISIWKLRRPTETCFLAGSCFLISGLISDRDTHSRLQDLSNTGLGERLEEGYGRIAFGIQRSPTLHINGDEIHKPSKPKNIPLGTKKILKILVEKALLQKVQNKALASIEQFDLLEISSSLISKLEYVKKKHDRKEFIDYLNELRPQAKKKLEKCSDGRHNLLEFFHQDIGDVIISEDFYSGQITDILEEVSPIQDSIRSTDFQELIYETFVLTFLSTARNYLKIASGRGGVR